MMSIKTAHAWLLEEAERSREWTEQLCQRYCPNLSQSGPVLPEDVCFPANQSSILMGAAQLGLVAAGLRSCRTLLLNISSLCHSESTNFSSPQKC